MGKSTANWIGDQGIKFDAANSPLAEAGKIAAHGVTSGAIAEITGGKFAAGAAGGAMSELASNWSLGAFSGNEEYQVALNKVLGGLAAVAVTGDENDFYTGADRAETVHRYNAMAHTLAALKARDPEQFAKLMEAKRNQYKTCGESAECKKMMIAGLGLVGLPLLPSELLAAGGIGGGAKFGFELWDNKGDLSKVDVGEVVFSTYLSAGTAGWSFWPTVAVNAAGGAYTSHLKGEDPLVGGFASSLGAGTGYWAGKFVEPLAKNLFNVNQNGIKYEFIDIGLTIQKNKPESIIPNSFGNAGGSISSELSTKFFESELKEADW